MDRELGLLLAVTRRLPTWKGLGRIPIWLRTWYLRKPRRPVEVDVWGARMRLAPEQFVDGWLLFGPQFYEASELRALTSLLRPGDVFVDVGAHVGLYTLQAARRVGRDGCVIAIEPNPVSAHELQHNIGLNGLHNVHVVRAAAVGTPGIRILAEPSGTNRAGATLLGAQHRPVSVAGRSLLDIVCDRHLSTVDVAKLDIEGVEHEVLWRFFADAPRSLWPRVVMSEHYPEFAARGGDVRELLTSKGYRLLARFGANYLFAMEGGLLSARAAAVPWTEPPQSLD